MLFGNVLGKSCDEHVESCIVGEGKSDKNLLEAEIEKSLVSTSILPISASATRQMFL